MQKWGRFYDSDEEDINKAKENYEKGCERWNEEGTCDACRYGFVLNDETKTCSINCEEYSEPLCVYCEHGYIVFQTDKDGTICYPVLDNTNEEESENTEESEESEKNEGKTDVKEKETNKSEESGNTGSTGNKGNSDESSDSKQQGNADKIDETKNSDNSVESEKVDNPEKSNNSRKFDGQQNLIILLLLFLL